MVYTSEMASRKTAASSFFLSAVSVRRTRWVKRGSRVETARSMSATLALISAVGVSGGGLGSFDSSFFSSSSSFFSSASSALGSSSFSSVGAAVAGAPAEIAALAF